MALMTFTSAFICLRSFLFSPTRHWSILSSSRRLEAVDHELETVAAHPLIQLLADHYSAKRFGDASAGSVAPVDRVDDMVCPRPGA